MPRFFLNGELLEMCTTVPLKWKILFAKSISVWISSSAFSEQYDGKDKKYNLMHSFSTILIFFSNSNFPVLILIFHRNDSDIKISIVLFNRWQNKNFYLKLWEF